MRDVRELHEQITKEIREEWSRNRVNVRRF
jgi:hypothetical protein